MSKDVETIAHATRPVEDPISETSEKLAVREVDGALAFLRNEADASITELDEKKLLRKIDFRIMPILFGVYVLQYIDKSLINYANVMGLSKDTNMSPADFSYLATFFYVTFAVFQPVHAYLMQKFPTAKYLAVNVMLWGVMLAVHSSCRSFGGLIVVRLLLGVFEASSAPCLILITGMWYKRAEQPLRVATWYLGVGAGTIVGALASFGFQHYTNKSFKSWQIMFLVFGIITVAWGTVVFLVLPDSPMTSRLSHNEKVLAIERLRENRTGIENKTFKREQFLETMLDPRTWLIVVIVIAGNVPTGACGTYSSTLIKGFGYTSKQSALLNIPSGAISMVAVLSASWYAGKFNNRGYGIVALLLPGVLGGGLMAFLPKSDKAGKLAGIYLTQVFGPNLSMMYSWAAANYAGHTKKICINATILFAYGASNIIGPLTFTGFTAPQYIPAKVAIMACLSLAIVTALVLRFWYLSDNKRRDRAAAVEGYGHVPDTEFMDLTDKQNPEFRLSMGHHRGGEMEGSAIAITNVSVTSLVNGEAGPSMAGKPAAPPITTSQSAEYCHRLADITARATLTDPLNVVFQQEKTGISMPVTADLLYIAAKRRTETKVAAGAIVVEACNFAAIACWEPPSSNPPPLTEAQFHEIARERPVFAQFARDIQKAQDICLGVPAPAHWKLSLMARDPERRDKGAVRAVIEPFVARAKAERVPLWLVAGNPRARDVYAYFGFRVVQEIRSFPEDGFGKDDGVSTWCMVCNWPLE